MKKYNIRVSGSIMDAEKDFKCGIDVSVSNGGSVANIGGAIQSAVDAMHAGAVVEKTDE